MITAINDLMYKHYKDNYKEFYIISEDDSGGILFNHSCKSYKYDNIIKLFLSSNKCNCTGLPYTPDSIYITNDKIYFIEFKNRRIVKRTVNNYEDFLQEQVKLKGIEGLFHFIESILVPLQINRRELSINFILVYSKQKNPLPSIDQLGKDLQQLANKESIRFGLSRLENVYFNSVRTYNDEEFKDIFERL